MNEGALQFYSNNSDAKLDHDDDNTRIFIGASEMELIFRILLVVLFKQELSWLVKDLESNDLFNSLKLDRSYVLKLSLNLF